MRVQRAASVPHAAASRRRVKSSALASIALAGLVGACAMADSTDLLGIDKGTCDSSAGTYYLSKSHLEVVVARDAAGGRPILERIDVKPRADRSNGYCLGFLASRTSRDTFVVQKDDNEQLLVKITSRAEDRSAEIVKTIVQTVFKGLEAAAGRFRSGEEQPQLPKAFSAEFDPFNDSQVDLLNDGLKDLGYCLYLDAGRSERMRRFSGISHYCNNPLGRSGRSNAMILATSYADKGERPGARFKRADGVLYRPRLPYTLYLFRNERSDVRLPGNWALWQSETVFLENRSPVLGIGIDRTYFATRKTTLRFAMGVLQDVYVDKGSELASASEIPLTIAQSMAALPSNIVKVKIDVTNKRESLIRAQDLLIEEERKLAAQRQALAAVRRSSGNGQQQPGQGAEDLPAAQADSKQQQQQSSSALTAQCAAVAKCEAAGTPRQTCVTAYGCP